MKRCMGALGISVIWLLIVPAGCATSGGGPPPGVLDDLQHQPDQTGAGEGVLQERPAAPGQALTTSPGHG